MKTYISKDGNRIVVSPSATLDDWPDYTEEAASPLDETLEAREYRNNLLAASDWTQVADAPVDQAAWATYRQALRNISQQDGFPNDITWPQEPSA